MADDRRPDLKPSRQKVMMCLLLVAKQTGDKGTIPHVQEAESAAGRQKGLQVSLYVLGRSKMAMSSNHVYASVTSTGIREKESTLLGFMLIIEN